MGTEKDIDASVDRYGHGSQTVRKRHREREKQVFGISKKAARSTRRKSKIEENIPAALETIEEEIIRPAPLDTSEETDE